MIRVWNPFIPTKANAVLTGHRSTICALVVIDVGKRIYSLSKDRCIKVWDVRTQNCIQVQASLFFLDKIFTFLYSFNIPLIFSLFLSLSLSLSLSFSPSPSSFPCVLYIYIKEIKE